MARNFAGGGDRCEIECFLKEAKQHAKSAGALDKDFTDRVTAIRKSLQRELEFPLVESDKSIKMACNTARVGDRSVMECFI